MPGETVRDLLRIVNGVSGALDEAEAMVRLAGADVGRVAVSIRGHPFVFPVNHRVVDGLVVFRTDEGTKLDGVFASPSVAYEVDGVDDEAGEAWSVVVVGHARAVADPDRLMELEPQLPRTFPGTEPPYLIEIHPYEISGRCHRLPAND